MTIHKHKYEKVRFFASGDVQMLLFSPVSKFSTLAASPSTVTATLSPSMYAALTRLYDSMISNSLRLHCMWCSVGSLRRGSMSVLYALNDWWKMFFMIWVNREEVRWFVQSPSLHALYSPPHTHTHCGCNQVTACVSVNYVSSDACALIDLVCFLLQPLTSFCAISVLFLSVFLLYIH